MRSEGGLLLLCAGPESWEGQPCLVVRPCAQPIQRYIEQAGHAFQQRLRAYFRKLGGGDSKDDGASDTESKSDDGSLEASVDETKWTCYVEAVIRADHEDYYALLGIPHLAGVATEKEIKKAYRQVSLFYHPDKNALGDIEQSDYVFKAIQKAYDHLTDPRKRQIYDSVLPFDDSIPDTDFVLEENFYEIFAPVFARNSRWSVSKPVPEMGDDNTDISHVNAFYEFWLSFSSWREFPVDEDLEIDEGMPREERRWVEKQRAKQQASQKKRESARIRKLVDSAMRMDPRLNRERKKREDAKAAIRAAKEAERFRKAEEERRKEEEIKAQQEEEKRMIEEEKKKQKAARDQEKQLIKNLKRKIRQIIDAANIRDIDTTSLLSGVCSDHLKVLVEELESDRCTPSMIGDRITVLQSENKDSKREESDRASDSPVMTKKEPVPAPVPAKAAPKPWSMDEISMLAKAFSRFPGGTIDRWEKISEFVGTRSVDEVMSKAKELKKSSSKKEPEPMVPAPMAASSPSSRASDRVEEDASKEESKDQEDIWTTAQQAMFEKALKTTPKDAPDRWDQISLKVPGKTRKECIRRFKEIRAKLTAKVPGN